MGSREYSYIDRTLVVSLYLLISCQTVDLLGFFYLINKSIKKNDPINNVKCIAMIISTEDPKFSFRFG